MSDNKNRGLYAKYNVERTDGKPVGQCFVLEVKDPNTWPALRAYAETVRDEYPHLAADVHLLVQQAAEDAAAKEQERAEEERVEAKAEEPGATPDLLANLRRSLAAAPDGKPVPLDSIDLPPEQPGPTPQPVPGSVAIATVERSGEEYPGELVARMTVEGVGDVWFAPRLGIARPEQAVTVTSRAVVVTEADRDELIENIHAATAGYAPSAVEGAIHEWFAAKLGGTR